MVNLSRVIGHKTSMQTNCAMSSMFLQDSSKCVLPTCKVSLQVIMSNINGTQVRKVGTCCTCKCPLRGCADNGHSMAGTICRATGCLSGLRGTRCDANRTEPLLAVMQRVRSTLAYGRSACGLVGVSRRVELQMV